MAPTTPHGEVVLHVISRFAGGGSEQRVLDIIEALPERHHVLVAGTMESPQRLDHTPVRVIESRHLVRPVAPLSDLRALLELRGLIRDWRPSLVVTHQSKAGVLGRLAAVLSRTRPLVAQSLSMSALDEAQSSASRKLYGLIERMLVPWTGIWLCVGQDLATQYQSLVGVPAKRSHVVRSSLDLTPFVHRDARDARRDLGVPEQPTVAYVGSFEDRKGVRSLSEVFRLLAERLGSVTALLLGDGPLRADVLSEVSGLDGVHVVAPGHVRKVHPYMQSSDALCLPSRAEGLPQVLVQAAAIGLPWVAHEGVCGVAELIAAGAAGTAVPAGDTPAFARAVERAIQDAACPATTATIDLSAWDPLVVTTRYRELLG